MTILYINKVDNKDTDDNMDMADNKDTVDNMDKVDKRMALPLIHQVHLIQMVKQDLQFDHYLGNNYIFDT